MLQNSCGVWYEFCPTSGNETENELGDSSVLCRMMGLKLGTSGRTQRQTSSGPLPQPQLDVFSTVRLRRDLQLVMRADRPLVNLVQSPCPATLTLKCTNSRTD